MVKNSPVRIWTTRHRPKRDPKFHQIDRFGGAGRSIKVELTIFKTG